MWQKIDNITPLNAIEKTDKILDRLHLDGPLVFGILSILIFGQFILFSATSGDWTRLIYSVLRIFIGITVMVILAQLKPAVFKLATPWLYGIALILLLLVDIIGYSGNGAQRWLDLGLLRFQPSELMKLGVPMMCALYLCERSLPATSRELGVLIPLILVPAGLTIVQPDLGTGILILAAGTAVVIFSGISWRILSFLGTAALAFAWAGWSFLHNYQQKRILTFLNPDSDPLGSGYHIIQSVIAIGSGGVFGKGYMHGAQGQLAFLPERSTDFIFAVVGEELGLFGAIILMSLYLLVVLRTLYLATQMRDTFACLFSSSVAIMFFFYVFINVGMVIGVLPVVGVPLPLVSYGGTAAVTMLASFGILMSLHFHQKSNL